MNQARLDIDLDAIADNVRQCRALLPAGTALIAVLKRDAYGLGLSRVAPVAAAAGVDGIAVASIAEAQEVAATEAGCALLVLGPFEPEAARLAGRFAIALSVNDAAEARAAIVAARKVGPFAVHLKLDTGLGRYGVAPGEAAAIARRLVRGGVALAGVYAQPSQPQRALEEFDRFRAAALAVRAIDPRVLPHFGNSAFLLNHGRQAVGGVRSGDLLFGLRPSGVTADAFPFRPVFAWRATLLAVHRRAAHARLGYDGFELSRASTIGTVGAGYADGFLRSFAGEVLVRGRRAPVIPPVNLGDLLVDLTGIEGAAPGDAVTLCGRDGLGRIPAGELAARAGVTEAEVLIQMSRSVRAYT